MNEANTDIIFDDGFTDHYMTLCYPDKKENYSIRLRHPNWFQRQIWRFFLGWRIEKD